MERKWGLVKFDPSDGEYHPLKEKFFTRRGACRAAIRKVTQLESLEPSDTTNTLHRLIPPRDRLFIQNSEGVLFRFSPKPRRK